MMKYQRPRHAIILAIPLVLLCSCTKSQPRNTLPKGAYRVKTKEVRSSPTSMTRQYSIETSSLRKLVLSEPGGYTSSSIGPDIMKQDPIGKAEATATATLEGSGKDAKLTIKLVVKSHGGTARCEETLSVPNADDLTKTLVETQPVGDLTTKTILLRAESGSQFLELSIE